MSRRDRRADARVGRVGDAARPRSRAARREPAAPATSLSLLHPAWIAAGLIAAASILVSVTFRIHEKDFWQHLAVGRAIWQLRHVPTTQVWTWPTYGAPDVNSSWGFRALIWPFWRAGGVLGLYLWRWKSTLIVFALCLAAARRLGARGFTPLVVLAVCALTYRQRSQVRPETLASIWLALSIWLMEVRRRSDPATPAGWRDPVFAMPLVIWAWANSHISHPLGFLVLGAYALADGVAGRTWRLRNVALAALASFVLALVNPFGVRALTQPFEYFFSQRGEPIYRIVPELWPPVWSGNLTNLLPLVLLGWLAIALGRAARRRADPAEFLLGIFFVGVSALSQRFLGFTMVALAPFLARDLDEWVAARRWPAWTSQTWSRAGLAAAACALCGIAEWRRPALPLGVGIDMDQAPVVACDVMEREGIGGRGFNQFYFGGYMLYRFWPDRSRLPFMDIHQTGTRRDRDAYVAAMADSDAWRALDDRYRFDYALLRRVAYPGDRLIDFLDADSAFALVFLDDAAALYVRRSGSLAPIAARRTYHWLPAGTERLGRIGRAALADSALRARVAAELSREAAESPAHSLALGRLGSLELATGDLASAKMHLEGALAVDPRAARAHERLGLIALAEGRPGEALGQLEAERRLNGDSPVAEYQLGRATQALGDFAAARRHYARALAKEPGLGPARDSLARLGGGP